MNFSCFLSLFSFLTSFLSCRNLSSPQHVAPTFILSRCLLPVEFGYSTLPEQGTKLFMSCATREQGPDWRRDICSRRQWGQLHWLRVETGARRGRSGGSSLFRIKQEEEHKAPSRKKPGRWGQSRMTPESSVHGPHCFMWRWHVYFLWSTFHCILLISHESFTKNENFLFYYTRP